MDNLTDKQRDDIIDRLIRDRVETIMQWAIENRFTELREYVAEAEALNTMEDEVLINTYIAQFDDLPDGVSE